MRKTSAALLTASLAAAGTVAAATLPAGAAWAVPPARAGAASASAAAAGIGRTGTTATQRQPARLSLPRPTGRYPVGTVHLHLVDRSRPNPWAASPAHRELMVSVWYPARWYPAAAT